METVELSQSILSLLPPLVAIVLAVLTRKVLVSLGAGIVLGALLLNSFDLAGTAGYIGEKVLGLVWDGGPNTWNLFIILFLLILGVMTTFISLAGGSRAFGEWTLARVKSRRGAQILTAFLGLFIFIDDYFNSLAVGNISRPLTDRHNISRAKLAYLIDSTAAPICVVSPVSSWGAYIIALIGSVLAAHGIAGETALSSFLQMVPMNFYAIFAVAMVFAVAISGRDFGPMARHEHRAQNLHLYEGEEAHGHGLTSDLPESDKGKVRDLVAPILVLIAATAAFMVNTGAQALEKDGLPFTILGAFENTDVAASLAYGGLVGLFATLALVWPKKLSFSLYMAGLRTGIKSMLPAIYILLFAWTIIEVIKGIGTGTYLAGLIDGSIDTIYLPALLFLVAGIMAFATGTSWGTFGIMLPIAGDIVAATDITLMLPALAAVLAGSVFGDHCSPISDTTILSSTGAGCHHMDHVLTQLPYTCLIALVSIVGYLVLGASGSVLLGFLAALAFFAAAVFLLFKVLPRRSEA